MSREEIQAQIDKVERQIANVKHHRRAREYTWPKQLAAVKRELSGLSEKLRLLKEQYDSIQDK